MKLSQNFYLRELTKSHTANRLGIDNTPDEEQIRSLRKVAVNLLQPSRDRFGIPFSPNSGFRCLELNREIGSKDTSQHIKGEAADWEIPGVSNYDLAAWIRDNLDFDQLILECYTTGKPSSGWVHASYVSEEENRNEVLTFDGKQFYEGLVL